MADLYPGMTIEVSTTFSALPDVSSRPSWLSSGAMWPPEPGRVMYMTKEGSTGICDQCAINPTCQDEIAERVRRGDFRDARKVIERGSGSWYCTCGSSHHGIGVGHSCNRWWNGSEYVDRR